MTLQTPSFHLSQDIDNYLAALSKLYLKKGERQKLDILVNSQVRTQQWAYDNWNGGICGHALFLTVPESLYLNALEHRDELQTAIRHDLNQVHNLKNEHIAEVFIEMDSSPNCDWRREFGALPTGPRKTAPEICRRIWGDSGYRIFLSHKSEFRKDAANLKSQMQQFGAACFVAHQDIGPTQAWQDEIESALASMDAFVALLTSGFHDSLWTDQEVGFAVGIGVPIIAVKFGLDPYGFIGKFQALTCSWDEAPTHIISLLINRPRMLDAYVAAAENCLSFDQGNALAKILPRIERITEEQATRLCNAFNENFELHQSFGFKGSSPRYYGKGLAAHLSRITGQNYSTVRGKIKLTKK